jgi:hypothetical protein
MPVIGFLGGETPDLTASRLRAFRQGLCGHCAQSPSAYCS